MNLQCHGCAAETWALLVELWGRYCELGSPTIPNRSCDQSQKIATLGNNLNAENGQYGAEDAELVRDGVPHGKQKKKDKDDDQGIEAKHQTCSKS
jgi:hypothetical protein